MKQNAQVKHIHLVQRQHLKCSTAEHTQIQGKGLKGSTILSTLHIWDNMRVSK